MLKTKKKRFNIAITGAKNSGKSSTVYLLKNILIVNGGTLKEIIYLKKDNRHFISTIEYGGKTIMLISADDYTEHLEKIETEFDICVCTTPSRGKSKDYISNMFNKIIWIEKGAISIKNIPSINSKKLQKENNKRFAYDIFKIIANL